MVRDPRTVTVTLTSNVPDRVADAAGLAADKRTAGTVVRVRSEDAASGQRATLTCRAA